MELHVLSYLSIPVLCKCRRIYKNLDRVEIYDYKTEMKQILSFGLFIKVNIDFVDVSSWRFKYIRHLECPCTDVIQLDNLVNLEFLDCSWCLNLTQLDKLVNLKKLICYGCDKLSRLDNLSNLIYLDCYSCENLEQLDNLINLITLKCNYCYELTQLDNLINLKELYCYGCPKLILNERLSKIAHR
jgi:hypothetical protein